jgi:hypothetical protein
MSADEPTGDREDVISRLRSAMGAIESTSTHVVRQAANQAPNETNVTATQPKSAPHKPITYTGMPEGKDWLDHLPPRIRHGAKGFDRRLAAELDAIGVPAYTLSALANVRTIPQAIPIFVDWLTHLDERIPGPETPHRQAIRAGLIRNLNDPAARGNRQAIDILLAQLRREPPLAPPVADFTTQAIATIATKQDFPTVARLLRDLPEGVSRGALIEYLGSVKTAEARQIALNYLDTEWTISALNALLKMKAAGVRQRVQPYVADPNAMVRKLAAQALERLPE